MKKITKLFKKQASVSSGSSTAKTALFHDDAYFATVIGNADSYSASELVKGFAKINLNVKEKEMKKLNPEGKGAITRESMFKFLEEQCATRGVQEIFDKYSSDKQFLTVQEFMNFLKEQGDTQIDLETARIIIKNCQFSESAEKMDVLGFHNYISSEANSIYNPAHTEAVYQNMDHPIAYYYIASSHNTYLLGHQLKGESSVEAYINAFKHGCKCVELDCWDGTDGEPIIFHGHTVVTKIKFRDVVQAVKDYGFCTSPFPVILSLENHCSVDQQIKMAVIMKEILGDMLPAAWVNKVQDIPSPAALKNKVLLKGHIKLTQAAVEEIEEEEEDDDEETLDEDAEVQKVKEKVVDKKEKVERPKKHKISGTAKDLADLIHLKSSSAAKFNSETGKGAPWEIISVSEGRVAKFMREGMEDIINYTLRNTCRVYPKGTRFDSSNYNPTPGWTIGCQVVALNYQTGSLPMWLNNGKFRDNGMSGYVLKPPYFLNFKDNHQVAPKKLTVKVISAWRLPKIDGDVKSEIIDPFVNVKMYGVPADQKKYKTKVINDNGFNPVWNETFTFELTRPDVAEIIFEVFDQDTVTANDFVGYCAVPVESIRPGYRQVYLLDERSNEVENASVLVHISFN